MLSKLLLLTIGTLPGQLSLSASDSDAPLFCIVTLPSFDLQPADHPPSQPNGSYLTEGIMGSAPEGCEFAETIFWKLTGR